MSNEQSASASDEAVRPTLQSDSGDHRAPAQDPDAELARKLDEATRNPTDPAPVSLRSVVKRHGDRIRALVVQDRSWGKARRFVEERLGRPISLRSLQTYMADLFPQRDLLRELDRQRVSAPTPDDAMPLVPRQAVRTSTGSTAQERSASAADPSRPPDCAARPTNNNPFVAPRRRTS